MSRNSGNEDSESEIRRMKLQVKQLLDENGFLRSDHEIIRKKYEKLSKENKMNKTENSKLHFEEFQKNDVIKIL